MSTKPVGSLQKLFSENIKKYRKLNGYSQAKLAELADITANYETQIESTRRFPSVEVIERLSEALKVESYVLFRDSDSEPDDEKQLKYKLLGDRLQQAVNEVVAEFRENKEDNKS